MRSGKQGSGAAAVKSVGRSDPSRAGAAVTGLQAPGQDGALPVPWIQAGVDRPWTSEGIRVKRVLGRPLTTPVKPVDRCPRKKRTPQILLTFFVLRLAVSRLTPPAANARS